MRKLVLIAAIAVVFISPSKVFSQMGADDHTTINQNPPPTYSLGSDTVTSSNTDSCDGKGDDNCGGCTDSPENPTWILSAITGGFLSFKNREKFIVLAKKLGRGKKLNAKKECEATPAEKELSS